MNSITDTLNITTLDQQSLEGMWRGSDPRARQLTEPQVADLRARLIHERLHVLDETVRKQMPDPGLPSLLAAVSLVPLGIGILCLTSLSSKVTTMTGLFWIVGGIVLLSICITWIVWSIRGRERPCLQRLLLKERAAAITLLITFPIVLTPFVAAVMYKVNVVLILMFGALAGAVLVDFTRRIRNVRRVRRQVESEIDAMRPVKVGGQ